MSTGKRHFYYTESQVFSRSQGGMNTTLKIYQLKKRRPWLVAIAKFNSASSTGDETEVLHALSKKKIVAQKYHRHLIYWTPRIGIEIHKMR